MKLLLDTQCWLWWFANPERLNTEAIESLGEEKNQLYLSVASIWEIAIKVSLGKLNLPEPPSEYIPSRMMMLGVTSVDIKGIHAILAASLPYHHRDPFDRMIIAQSQIEQMQIVTADSVFNQYDVNLIWCKS